MQVYGKWLACCALMALMLGATGCAKKDKEAGRQIMPDPLFSWNLVEVPADWPNEKKDWPKNPETALRQQNVYERHGRPDYFRLRWYRDGRIVTDADVSQLALGKRGPDLKKFLRDQDYEWIYLEEDLAFNFTKGTTKQETVSDELRTIADLGDPNDIKEVNDVTDGTVIKYTYYGLGRIIHFRDGKKVREEKVQAVHGVKMRK